MTQTLLPNLKCETVRKVRMHKCRSESVNAADLIDRSYYVSAESEDRPLTVGHGIKKLRFFRGHFFIDNIHVVAPRYISDFVSWRQLTKDHYTSGHLHFTLNGALLTGTIALGTTKANAVTYHVLASYFPFVTPKEFAAPTATAATDAAQPLTFNTKMTKARYAPGTAIDFDKIPPEDVQTGTLTLGYDLVQQAIVCEIHQDDDFSEAPWMLGYSIPKNGTQANQMQLDLLDDYSSCDLGASGSTPSKASITITMLSTTTFVGAVMTTCGDPGANGKPYDKDTNPNVFIWQGSVPSNQVTATVPSKTALLTSAALLTDSSLDVNVLAGLIPNNTVEDNITSLSNEMLVENMKWAIAQDPTKAGWLTLFYTENPPALDDNRKALINRSLDWYQNHYAKAQLGWQTVNYAGTNQPTTQLSDDKKLQLKYYLQTGIGTDPDFNTQQAGIYTEAYILSIPTLQTYLNDTVLDAQGRTGGEKWAQALYDQVYLPNMSVAIMAYKLSSDATPIHQKCSLLTVLQPSGKLAQQYFESVIKAQLNVSSESTDFTNKDLLMEWLPDWLNQFLTTAAANPSSIPEAGQIVVQEMNVFLQQQGGDTTKVATAMVDILTNAPSSTIWSACLGAETSWKAKYPAVSNVGKAFFIMAWSYGISQIVTAFANWQKLTDEDKGKLITATVASAVQTIQMVPEIIYGIKEAGQTVISAYRKWSASNTAIVDDVGGSIAKDWVQVGMDETTPLVDATTKTVTTEGTLWARVFSSKVIQVLLKGVAIIVAVAIAIFSFIDFANDLQSGQPITRTVLDGFMAATNAVVAVAVVFEVVLSSVIASVVGTVFAILGAIISIIEMFVVKPANPLETFMSQVVVPFVDGLPPQTPPPTGGSATPTAVVFA